MKDGFVEIMQEMLGDVPKMLERRNSGLFVADARSFPASMLTIDLFFNPKIDIRRRELTMPERRQNLVDRHYRLVSKKYRKNPLDSLFASLKLGDQKSPTLFMIGYQATVRMGFLPDTPLYYVESKAAAAKAIGSLLTGLPCVQQEGLDAEDIEKIVAYIGQDLHSKEALRHNIKAGQAADELLFDA